MFLGKIIKSDSNYKEKLESIGYGYHTDENGVQYWVDDRYMSINEAFADRIFHTSTELWEKCLVAVQYVIDNKLYDKFFIPSYIIPHIEKSWENDVPSIYGRFDFGYDPKTDSLKLLEFNADTPTSLFESGVVQWDWKNRHFGDKHNVDQFNAIHEQLIDYWKHLKPYLKGEILHFSCVRESLEDITNVDYLMDCALQAGISCKFLYVDEIGWNGSHFVDMEEEGITDIFKLYPWEWMINEEFGNNIVADSLECNWIEPSWKMILSNKAILPILFDLYPQCESILECYFNTPNGMASYAKKPIFSREGANVSLMKDGELLEETGGEYGEEGFIYQELVDLYRTEHGAYIIGSWIIGGESVGISFRESNGLITDNMSRYIPHIIE